MAVELRDAANRYELLEKDNQAKSADLKKVLDAAKETRSEIRATREELRQARDIAAGSPYLLRMKFGDPKYAPLDRQWSSDNAYLDLAASVADTTEHFRSRGDHELEELFWSQYHNPERPLSVSDHLAAWAELNRLSRLAMKYVASRLWPEKPEPKSYFGLVQQFLGSESHADAMKRSACIEGAQMALSRVKTYWADMKASIVASQDSDESRVPAKHYFEEVLPGARIIESQCSKDVVFE